MSLPAGHEWRSSLLERIHRFIARAEPDETEAAALARELAALHYAEMPVYRRFCDIRGVAPAACENLRDLPALPTDAFKRAELHIAPETVERRFSTSGTTGGEEHKGVACYSADDLTLMDTAIDANAERYLFPDHNDVRTRIFVLAPPPAAAPQMIMVYGMDRLVRRYGAPESRFLVGAQGLELDALLAALQGAAADRAPVTLIGASFGFVHLFEYLAEAGRSFVLPPASRIMDAGGFKGRSRAVTRREMLEAFQAHLGVPETHCVNLLGLTEHASQFYDDARAAAAEGRAPRRGKQNAPWTRTWAVDPETLEILPHGQPGLLRHLDLANGGHPFIVQTDDLGATTETGFEVIGRADAAQSRGCSITVDELMEGTA